MKYAIGIGVVVMLAVGLTEAAGLAVVEIGEFQGTLQESFEEFQLHSSIPDGGSIFGGAATIQNNSLGINNFFRVPDGSQYAYPQVYNFFFAFDIVFSDPVHDFGGYFNSTFAGVSLQFFDPNDELIFPCLCNAPASGGSSFVWAGWTSEIPIKRIHMSSQAWSLDYLQANTVSNAGCWQADIDGDQQAGVTDLLLIIAQWGACPAECVADVDGDGQVGVQDLLILLGNWGPCL